MSKKNPNPDDLFCVFDEFLTNSPQKSTPKKKRTPKKKQLNPPQQKNCEKSRKIMYN